MLRTYACGNYCGLCWILQDYIIKELIGLGSLVAIVP
jgi:hypothetical protein